ncbi:MAG: hypothetical protein LBK18_06965 [Prevotellaceae bacterium]|nr:hypothetical protein [Prevotellaceae bacterium]
MRHVLLTVFIAIFSAVFSAIFCATLSAEPRQQPPDTERLLQDLRGEGCCAPGFAPSAALVQRYRLYRLPPDSSYCTSGFLSVDGNAQPSDFRKFGVAVGTQVDSLWTVHVPVQNLPALLNAKGVKTFETGKKASARRR